MILYTVMPLEFIFGDPGYKARETKEIDYMGVKVEVTKGSDNEMIINRVISSAPKDYLNPELQPGKIVSLKENNF
jgi:hypothetical protein